MSSINGTGKIIIGILALTNICLDIYLSMANGIIHINKTLFLISILITAVFYLGLLRGVNWIRWIIVSMSAIRIIACLGIVILIFIYPIIIPGYINIIDIVFNLVISTVTFVCLTMVNSVREYFEDLNNCL